MAPCPVWSGLVIGLPGFSCGYCLMRKGTAGIMKRYQNLVFDVGGVLIGFRWQDMLADHGMEPDYAAYFGETLFSDPLWKELDREVIPFEDAFRYLQAI